MPDWVDWHRAYDRDSELSTRLALVQERIREAAAGRGGLRVVSLCAGAALDLRGALAGREGVSGCAVELDPRLAREAEAGLAAAGLDGVEVIRGDAAELRHYAPYAPADLVLVCGVFGNIRDDDVERTVAALPMLCARGAHVVWTRNRRAPDLTPAIRRWLAAAGFAELRFDPVREVASVGAHRFDGEPAPLREDVRLFDFVGADVLRRGA